MIYYYFFTILVPAAGIINRVFAGVACIIIICLFLIYLPDNGSDYGEYRATYEAAYFTTEFPWLKTYSVITSEPFFLFYGAFIRVVIGFDYPGFLALNFLICGAIFWYAIKDVLMRAKYDTLFFAVPVIVPTMFYWSPRSSLAFCLIVLVFRLLVRRRLLLALAAGALAIFTHSQIIPVFVYLLLFYFVLHNYNSGRALRLLKRMIVLVLPVLLAFFALAPQITSAFAWMFSVLGLSPVAVAKLHYLTSVESGVRITSILPIVVYPMLYYLTFRNYPRRAPVMHSNPELNFRYIAFLGALVLFGLAINLAFFQTPHLSGRLSRVPDYLNFMFLLPLALTFLCNRIVTYGVLIVFSFITPVLYSTLYVGQW